MRALLDVYKIASGKVIFEERDITNRPPHEIVASGLTQAPEGRQIFSAMTVQENLKLGSGTHPAADFANDLERMLTRFPRVKERIGQKAGSMSGGEQQTLCIDRALMSRPRLLLMDEPSMGLAPIVVRQVFDLVRDIRAEGMAVLLLEQNARAAIRVADTAYVMDSGAVACKHVGRRNQ